MEGNKGGGYADIPTDLFFSLKRDKNMHKSHKATFFDEMLTQNYTFMKPGQ